MSGREFKVIFDQQWFNKDDVLTLADGAMLVVVTDTPKRTWWRVFLQWITFGWYKAPWYYTVKTV